MFWWLLFGVLLFAFFTSKSDARWLPVVIAGQIWVKARKLSKRYCPSKRDKKRAAGIYTHDDDNDTTSSTSPANTNEPSSTSGSTSGSNGVSTMTGSGMSLGAPPTPTSTAAAAVIATRGTHGPLGLPRVKATWMEDKDAPDCCKCHKPFTLMFRRHHCRVCKKIFCDPCSSQKYSGRRTCVDCYVLLQAVQNGTLKIKPKSAAGTPSASSSTSSSSSSSSSTSTLQTSGQAFKLGDSAPIGDEVKQDLRRVRTSDELKNWVDRKRAEMVRELKDDKLFKAEAVARKVLEALNEESKILLDERQHHATQWIQQTEYKRIQLEVTQSRALMSELANDDGWVTVSRDSTAHTMSRKEEGKSLYSFKVVGDVKQPIWKITACIYEIDLFPTWFPFMAAARDLKTISRFRKFAQLTIRSIFPFDARDMVIDGYGVDFSEENKILVNVRSVERSEHLDIPPPAKSTVRAFMHLGGFLIEPINETRCRLSFMVNMDLQMSLPAWLLNTVSQKLIHVILGRIKQASNFDEKTSEYAKRAKANPLVYQYIQDAADAHFARMRGRPLPPPLGSSSPSSSSSSSSSSSAGLHRREGEPMESKYY